MKMYLLTLKKAEIWLKESGEKMSNSIRRMRKKIKVRSIAEPTQEYQEKILVHGSMIYRCERCGREWRMYLEKGIEEFGDNHKPSPFIIPCKRCGGMAKDISGIMKFAGGGYYPLPDGASYFANKKGSDCGVPILN